MIGDTIAAIATPLGEGGIGIVRMSGERAVEFADNVFRSKSRKKLADSPSHHLNLGVVLDENGEEIDEVLACVMRNPRSYTGEDVVEINCHGGPVVLKRLLGLLLAQGARMAEPGEFTKRAFLNGKLDLAQAEGVIDTIRALTDSARKLALGELRGLVSRTIESIEDKLIDLMASIDARIDFPDDVDDNLDESNLLKQLDDLVSQISGLITGAKRGRIYREGLNVVIAGRPNVGKSSLLNALTGGERAIVTDIPGTTRDAVDAYINVDGIPVRIVDTAGIRRTEDPVERLGVTKTLEFIDDADIVLYVVDSSEEISGEDLAIIDSLKGKKVIAVLNKSDLPEKLTEDDITRRIETVSIVPISAEYGHGLDELQNRIKEAAIGTDGAQVENVMIANLRHEQCLSRARQALCDARNAMSGGVSLDAVTVDLHDALDALGEITGKTVSDEVVDRIFARFCVGK